MAQAATETGWLGRSYIDGRWSTDEAAQQFRQQEPGPFRPGAGLLSRAARPPTWTRRCEAARRAFGPWRRTSRIKRGEQFGRLASLIERHVDELAAVLARESGKVLDKARAEVVEGLHMVQYVYGTARQPIGEVIASEIEAKDLYVVAASRVASWR